MSIRTVKMATKRLRVTKKGKILFRHSGQNHFNAKADGNQTREKRGFKNLPKNQVKVFKEILAR